MWCNPYFVLLQSRHKKHKKQQKKHRTKLDTDSDSDAEDSDDSVPTDTQLLNKWVTFVTEIFVC